MAKIELRIWVDQVEVDLAPHIKEILEWDVERRLKRAQKRASKGGESDARTP